MIGRSAKPSDHTGGMKDGPEALVCYRSALPSDHTDQKTSVVKRKELQLPVDRYQAVRPFPVSATMPSPTASARSRLDVAVESSGKLLR